MTSLVRTRLLFFWTIVVLECNASVLQAQREHMVIAADAVCRSEPNVSAAKVHSYQLGDLAIVTKESQEDGTVWYFDSSWLDIRCTHDGVLGIKSRAIRAGADRSPAPAPE